MNNSLVSLAVVLTVATIALSMGGLVLEEISHTDQVCDTWTNVTVGGQDVCTDLTYAYNATNQGEEGMETTSSFLPVVAIVIVAAVIIGIVAQSFRG